MDIRELEDFTFRALIEYGLATEKEIYRKCGKYGYTYKTLLMLVYEKTGYRDIRMYILKKDGCL